MDPYAVLGLPPGASVEEATVAWKRLAKRWHPDRVGASAAAAERMAEINAAYDLVRNAPVPEPSLHRGPLADEVPHEPHGVHITRRRPRVPGVWLEEGVRRALGRELLAVLDDGEPVHLVTRASTWKSPEARLAVTDRRLLWLLDDQVTNRVRSLHHRAIAEVDHRLAWPRRRTATLEVLTREGKRLTFSELAPTNAAAIVRHVRAGAPRP